MAITEVLRLVLDADMKGGVQQVERFGATAKRELGKSEQSLDKWGKGLTSVGAGMIGFGSAALFGLGKAAQASEEANLSVVKLENTISNMPKLAGQNSDGFIELAESIQDVTAADADAIVAGQAMLGTFNVTAEQLKGITPLVVDYARKFGIDLVAANTQVGKALDGSVGALKKNGVSIDENVFKTDRYAAVTEALRNQVGGFAEEEGKTFAGSVERMKNQMGDLVEGVGVGAVDAFSDLLGVVEPVIDEFNSMDPAVQSTIGKVATFGSIAVIAAGGASVLIGQVIKARENFSTAWGAVSGLTDRVGGFKNAALLGGTAVAALTTTFMIWQDEQARARAEQERLMNAMRETEGAIKGVTEELVVDAFRPWIEDLNDAGVGLDDLTAALDGDEKAIKRVTEASFELGNASGQGLRRSLDAGTDAIGRTRTALEEEAKFAGDAAEATGEVGDAASGATGGVDEFGEALDEQTIAAEEAKTALDAYTDKVRAMTDPLFGMLDAFTANSEAQQGVLDAQTKLNDVMADGEATTVDVAEAQAKLDEAYRRVGQTAVDVDVAAAELNSTIEQNPALVDAAKTKLNQWVAQGIITQEQAFILGAQFDATAQSARNLGATDPNVYVTQTGAVVVRSEIELLKQQIDQIDGRVAHVEVNFRTGGVSIAEMIRFSGARQHGGPVTAGDAFLVGEKGPELFVPGRDGRIFTEQQVAAAGSYAGGGRLGGGSQQVEVLLKLEAGGGRLEKAIIDSLRPTIRNNFGGDVQRALGYG